MKNIYKIIFLLLFQSAISNQQSFSQTAPGIEWQNTIGGDELDVAFSIQQTSDGGFIVGGGSRSNISGDKTENNWDTLLQTYDYWIVKLGAVGNIQWQNTIGGNRDDLLYSMQQTTDGGYILGGYSYSDISGDKTQNSGGPVDYWVVKVDSTGVVQWQNSIGGSQNDFLSCIKQTIDGGFIIGGWSDSDSSGDKNENSLGWEDYWVVKLHSNGTIQWQNTIGGNFYENLHSIQQTSDGGYILGGDSDSDSSGDKTEDNIGLDIWVVKLDSLGTIQWQNTIGGDNEDGLYSIQQTTDGGYILGGTSSSDSSVDKTENSLGGNDYWVIKLDSIGIIKWQNTIGGNNFDNLASIEQTIDGGFILGGWSLSDSSGDKKENTMGYSDYWAVKLNFSGTIQWENTITANFQDMLHSIKQTNDGGYILCGESNSNFSGDKNENSMGTFDYWIVKLGPDTITGISPTPSAFGGDGVAIAPNPLVTQSILTFTNPHKEKFLFILYDITGRVVETISTATEQIILNKGRKQAGLYLFFLRNEKTGENMNGKIVIQ